MKVSDGCLECGGQLVESKDSLYLEVYNRLDFDLIDDELAGNLGPNDLDPWPYSKLYACGGCEPQYAVNDSDNTAISLDKCVQVVQDELENEDD